MARRPLSASAERGWGGWARRAAPRRRQLAAPKSETARSQLPATEPLLSRDPCSASRCVPGISICAGGTMTLLGSTLVRVARSCSLPPSATRSVAGGAPSSSLWDCSAGASDLPRRACQDLPSPGSPITAAPSRPATHAQIQRGMTNVIDLDEPHLKRERMIQGEKGDCKGKSRALLATCSSRVNYFVTMSYVTYQHSPQSLARVGENMWISDPSFSSRRGSRRASLEKAVVEKSMERTRESAPQVLATRPAPRSRTPPRTNARMRALRPRPRAPGLIRAPSW